MKKIYKLGLASSILVSSLAYASGNHHMSKYVGEENRVIKSLSESYIKDLQKGAGLGLAKAAELNGYPGPSHLLKMKDDINLTKKQQTQIKDIYASMQKNAIKLGEKIISLEKELNNGFKTKIITQEDLEKLVLDIENTKAKLRIVHLSTHLKTPEILTTSQIDLYNKLRGYSISH